MATTTRRTGSRPNRLTDTTRDHRVTNCPRTRHHPARSPNHSGPAGDLDRLAARLGPGQRPVADSHPGRRLGHRQQDRVDRRMSPPFSSYGRRPRYVPIRVETPFAAPLPSREPTWIDPIGAGRSPGSFSSSVTKGWSVRRGEHSIVTLGGSRRSWGQTRCRPASGPIGTVKQIGRYRLDRVIGSGAFATFGRGTTRSSTSPWPSRCWRLW
jgi:hypothetical protein